MKRFNKYIAILIGLVSLPSNALAQSGVNPFDEYNPLPLDANSVLDSLLNRIPIFLGAFAVLALLIAGAQYIFAMGDSTKIEASKKTITWTIIGIVASTSVYILIQLALWLVNPSI